MNMENYYSVLGVVPSASEEEIKRAYRKLSVKMHPDKNEGDDFFEDFFKKINEAYYVLGNSQRRKEYDALFGAEKEVKEPVKKAENVNRKNEFVADYSYVWREVKIWRRVKNFLLVLNVCILLVALLPRIGFEMPFEKSEKVIMYGKTNTENSLNLRRRPSLDAEILTKIPSKVRVEILEEGESYMWIGGEYGNWLKIKYGENVGWVWSGCVDRLEDVENTNETRKLESEIKTKSVENILVQRNDYTIEEEPELNESDFVEDNSDKEESGKSSNPFGNDAIGGTGIGNGREGTGLRRNDRTRLNDVNLDDLVIYEDAVVAFRLSVNSDGKVESADKDSERTTTSNTWLISEIRKRVIAQVRYSKSKGSGLEMFNYSVKVSAD